MTRPWDDASDDELLDLLGTALAVDDEPALAPVVPLHRRSRWVRPVAYVAVAAGLVAMAGVLAQGGDGGTVTTPSTISIDVASAAIDGLETALDRGDLEAVRVAAAAVRELPPSAQAAYASRIARLLSEADAMLAPTTTTTTTMTPPTTAPGAGPPATVGTTVPDQETTTTDDLTTSTTDDHGGGSDNSGPGSGSSGPGSGGHGSDD
jgi:hypothetical protein